MDYGFRGVNAHAGVSLNAGPRRHIISMVLKVGCSCAALGTKQTRAAQNFLCQELEEIEEEMEVDEEIEVD